MYLADVHNILAKESLGWQTPCHIRKGWTPNFWDSSIINGDNQSTTLTVTRVSQPARNALDISLVQLP